MSDGLSQQARLLPITDPFGLWKEETRPPTFLSQRNKTLYDLKLGKLSKKFEPLFSDICSFLMMSDGPSQQVQLPPITDQLGLWSSHVLFPFLAKEIRIDTFS